jgi:hypothetical protein
MEAQQIVADVFSSGDFAIDLGGQAQWRFRPLMPFLEAREPNSPAWFDKRRRGTVNCTKSQEWRVHFLVADFEQSEVGEDAALLVGLQTYNRGSLDTVHTHLKLARADVMSGSQYQSTAHDVSRTH